MPWCWSWESCEFLGGNCQLWKLWKLNQLKVQKLQFYSCLRNLWCSHESWVYPFFLAPSKSILDLLWISFIQSPGVIWDGYSMGDRINQCWNLRLGSSRLSWCCSSFAIPYLGGSKLVFKIGEKGGCGWLRGCEQCEIYWIMHLFCWKLHMQYEIIWATVRIKGK